MNTQEIKKTREEAILQSISRFDYLSRSQLQKLHNLSGDRNSRRVLAAMTDLLSRFRDGAGENIYYLTRAGRERVDCQTVRQKSNQVNHYLMRNDLYIHLKPTEWRNEQKIGVEGLTLICDAYFKLNQRHHFLEVDHLQHMTKNREKIEKYKKIKATGAYQKKIGYFPPLIWVTNLESRKKQIYALCEGLDSKVYLWDEIK